MSSYDKTGSIHFMGGHYNIFFIIAPSPPSSILTVQIKTLEYISVSTFSLSSCATHGPYKGGYVSAVMAEDPLAFSPK